MSEEFIRRPKMRAVKLTHLSPMTDRAGRLSKRQRDAIKAHIAETGVYPAIIVRPTEKRFDKYQIIDGHMRAEILAELGWKSARCEIWPVDGDQARLLSVSLNQLRGRPDGQARGKLLGKLTRKFGFDVTADRLGMTVVSLRRYIQQGSSPKLSPCGPALQLRPVVFHLPPDKAEILAEVLDHFAAGKGKRSEALIKAVMAGRNAKADGGSK